MIAEALIYKESIDLKSALEQIQVRFLSGIPDFYAGPSVNICHVAQRSAVSGHRSFVRGSFAFGVVELAQCDATGSLCLGILPRLLLRILRD
jgi:hypothetical protein